MTTSSFEQARGTKEEDGNGLLTVLPEEHVGACASAHLVVIDEVLKGRQNDTGAQALH